MNRILSEIKSLKKTGVKKLVDNRLKELEELGKNKNTVFKELCFCLLTANYSAEGGIKIQKCINEGFFTLSEEELTGELKKLGHRFPAARSKYIVEARKHCEPLSFLTKTMKDTALREWLVKNVKGLGYKEASHFLRNIGYKNLAIIDFHIIDALVKGDVIERPKTLTPKRYLEIERKLQEIAEKTNLSLAELDFYLWYMETGKVLK